MKKTPYYQTTTHAAFVVADGSDPQSGFIALIYKRTKHGYGDTPLATCMVESVVKDRVKNMSKRVKKTRVLKMKAA
jgi:hypothetical protein